jgi:hypothetical protein
VVLHVGSRSTYEVEVSFFWHIVFFCPFLMVPGVGHLGKSFGNEVGKKYKEFQDASILFK